MDSNINKTEITEQIQKALAAKGWHAVYVDYVPIPWYYKDSKDGSLQLEIYKEGWNVEIRDECSLEVGRQLMDLGRAIIWGGEVQIGCEDLFVDDHFYSIVSYNEKSLLAIIDKLPVFQPLKEPPSLKQIPEEVIQLGRNVHEAIHDHEKKHVEVDGLLYPITRHSNGCRCVKIGSYLFMEQTKKRNTPTAIRARRGERLTWIMPSIPDMEWWLIEDE